MFEPRVEELKSLLPRAMLPDWVRIGSRLSRLLRDRLHPDKHDAVLNRLLDEARRSVELREQRAAHVPRVSYPPDLPITARKDEIVRAIRENQVVVLAGETGSGKTTQIPKMCLEAGLGIEARIGCTQPRRVAALSISRRIAKELNVEWGREVGCKIRFDDRSSPQTFIKLMTDGILLAETQGDPNLADYNALIIDEAHERSLNIDFLLGYLKLLLARRNDLKLIVTSATIDTDAFSRHFNNAPVIEVSGRMYPVEVLYAPIGEELDDDADQRAAGFQLAEKAHTISITPVQSNRPEQSEPRRLQTGGTLRDTSLANLLPPELRQQDAGGTLSYVDACVLTAERILYETSFGDLLIFLPTERDIRECSDQLEGRFSGEAEIIPLFGRLSAGDQQRVFSQSPRRKVVVATNIAETSLTIPGIRYVIDAGLARLSRYNPRTRTKRLPIEPISQSSANQRKGRAGRVQDGVCIRLYAEDDFNARPPFTQPEIQRANLAEVILRMKAFHLGDIDTFPFVQPPTPAAIASGYALLQELGALDERRELTELGRDLARLPIDPTLGRMLLQAQREHATRELLIIAAGLSIQDPRERPLDAKDAAAAAHKRFNDPKSDFLALLNIWDAVHDEWERLRTQNQRRKFCRQHFLSYLRMREWQDLYAQLHDSLEELGSLQLNESNAAYEAIHRSILAGLVGHVATREERNLYKGAGNRTLTLFPGSALYERGVPAKKPGARDAKTPQPKPKSNQPQWIVAGEIVETSQLFARTVAGIDPQWIFQVAPHVCKVTHRNPHWSPEAGRVLAEEVATLHGLEVQRRKVAYGNVNAKEATEIFIRSALVEENLLPARTGHRESRGNAERDEIRNELAHSESERALPGAYRFLEHNRRIRQKIENWQTRVRRYDLGDVDQRLFEFYAKRIENVSSIHELNRFLREHPPEFLCVTEADLAGDQSLKYDEHAFPDAVHVSGQPVAVSYAYAPGEAHDGVTIRLPFTIAQTASAAWLEWAVPGLREEKVAELLRALPKSIRRELMPFPPKVAEIVAEFQPSTQSLLTDLARFLTQRYGVKVNASDWPGEALPAHLRPRVEIIGGNEKTVAAGRDLNALRSQIEQVKVAPTTEPQAWQRAAQRWERFGLTTWSIGDLPERMTVSEGPGLPVYAWPGLEFADGNVNLRLFRTPESARDNSAAGLRRLVELAVQKDLGWLEKDLRALNRLAAFYEPLGSVDELQESALENLKRYVLPTRATLPLTQQQFEAAVAQARERLPGLAQKLIDVVSAILQQRQQTAARIGAPQPSLAAPKAKTLNDFSQLGGLVRGPAAPPTNPLAAEIAGLVPPRFLDTISFERLPHLTRYLKALQIRAERAALNPAKDRERIAQLAPYTAALNQLLTSKPRTAEAREAIDEFRWLVEEFKVSLFAQELRTPVPVSPKRLDEQLARVRQWI
jgi:ATP-dependent helicase HrpA